MKDLDLVLFGASGFTGRLVAENLRDHGGDARWALAGRNRGKLESVAQELGIDVPILIGDAADAESLAAIVKKTNVVCSTVGPYAQHGTPLVEQCVAGGIGYCDLTGEPHWIKEMIERFHHRAIETGARIVHCCGFDSIPSDLGTLMIADHVRDQYGQKLRRVRMRLIRSRGRASGGTVASAFGVLKAMRDRSTRRALFDPYTFDPGDSARGPDRSERWFPHRDPSERVIAPFPMSFINARVVRRSNALLAHRYGESFEYDEGIDVGSGLSAWSRGLAISAGMIGFAASSVLPPMHLLLKRMLPRPGEGPSKEQRERGSFLVHLLGESDGSPTVHVKGTVASKGDPGYAATSRMLMEAALCLAKHGSSAGGVLTPAVAMGTALIERLRRAGMTFAVEASRAD